MGIHNGSVFTTTLVNTALTATDVIVLTTPALSPGFDNAGIQLFWYLQYATGAGGTTGAWKLSRGTAVSGSPLLSGTLTTVAATNFLLAGCFVDTPGVVAGQQYTLSINDNGGAGTAQLGCMIALVL